MVLPPAAERVAHHTWRIMIAPARAGVDALQPAGRQKRCGIPALRMNQSKVQNLMDAQHQLAGAKRLRHVILRAQFQPEHA